MPGHANQIAELERQNEALRKRLALFENALAHMQHDAARHEHAKHHQGEAVLRWFRGPRRLVVTEIVVGEEQRHEEHRLAGDEQIHRPRPAVLHDASRDRRWR